MSDLTRPERPIHRNIHISQIIAYRLPAAGVLSILHRVSGALMFLAIPFVLYLFDRSLTSAGTFGEFKAVASSWWAKLVLLVLIWSYLHHSVAGIRHLFMDVHIGLDITSGRQTALVVFAVSLVLWLACALKMFGAF